MNAPTNSKRKVAQIILPIIWIQYLLHSFFVKYYSAKIKKMEKI